MAELRAATFAVQLVLKKVVRKEKKKAVKMAVKMDKNWVLYMVVDLVELKGIVMVEMKES